MQLIHSIHNRFQQRIPSPFYRTFVLGAAFSLVIIILTATFSIDFYHADEHFQILEFANYKLGKTPAEALPWEFHTRSRGWMQPALYVVIIEAATAVGITNPFDQVFLLRLFNGLIGWLALLFLALTCRVFFRGDETRQRIVMLVLFSVWYLPYILVRTSSEALSTSLFAIGFSLLFLTSSQDETDRFRFRLSMVFLASLFFGFAFCLRYHVGVMLAGLVGWIVFTHWRYPLLLMRYAAFFTVGFAITFGLGMLVDRWGWGSWELTPWNYLYFQVFQGASTEKGTSWFFAYLYRMSEHLAAPLSLGLTLLAVIAMIRFPKHPLTWVTGSLVIIHSILGRILARYLFPILIYIPFLLILAFTPKQKPLPKWLQWLWDRRKSPVAKVFYSWNFLALVILIFMQTQYMVSVQRFVYESYQQPVTLITTKAGNPYSYYGLAMYLYRPEGFHLVEVDEPNELDKAAAEAATPHVLIAIPQLTIPENLKHLQESYTMVYRTLPGWVNHVNWFNWLARTKQWIILKRRE